MLLAKIDDIEKYADNSLWNNYDFVKELFQREKSLYDNDTEMEIALRAILKKIQIHIIQNSDFLKEIVFQWNKDTPNVNRIVFDFCNESSINAILRIDGMLLKYVQPDKQTRSNIVTALNQEGFAYRYIATPYKADPELVGLSKKSHFTD